MAHLRKAPTIEDHLRRSGTIDPDSLKINLTKSYNFSNAPNRRTDLRASYAGPSPSSHPKSMPLVHQSLVAQKRNSLTTHALPTFGPNGSSNPSSVQRTRSSLDTHPREDEDNDRPRSSSTPNHPRPHRLPPINESLPRNPRIKNTVQPRLEPSKPQSRETKPLERRLDAKPSTMRFTDFKSFLEWALEHPESDEFVYCRIVSEKFDFFDPYNLSIIPHTSITDSGYFTASPLGITSYYGRYSEFTNLADWIEERRWFELVRKQPFFQKFRISQCFNVWEGNARRVRIAQATSIKDFHFFSSDPLHNCMVEVKTRCESFRKKGIQTIDPDGTYTILKFTETITLKRRLFSTSLSAFGDELLVLVDTACRETLKLKGFTDDNADIKFAQEQRRQKRLQKKKQEEQRKKAFLSSLANSRKSSPNRTRSPSRASLVSAGSQSLLRGTPNQRTRSSSTSSTGHGSRPGSSHWRDQLEAEDDDISYAQVAAKRNEYRRLACFIRTVDYIVLDMQHAMIADAAVQLYNTLIERIVRYPPTPPEMVEVRSFQATKVKSLEEKSKREGYDGLTRKNSFVNILPLSKSFSKYGRKSSFVSLTSIRALSLLPTDKPPVFEISLEIDDNHLKLMNTMQDYVNTTVELLNHVVTDLSALERMMLHPVFLRFTTIYAQEDENGSMQGDDEADDSQQNQNKEHIDEEVLNKDSTKITLRNRLKEDSEILNMKEMICKLLKQNFDEIIKYSKAFTDFIQIFIRNQRITADNLLNVEHSVDWFIDALTELNAQTIDMGLIGDEYEVGLFRIKTDTLRQALLDSTDKHRLIIHAVLPQITNRKRAAHLDNLSRSIDKLTMKPETPEEFELYLKNFADVRSQQSEFNQTLDEIDDLNRVMKQFEIAIENSDVANHQLTHKTHTHLFSILLQADASIEEKTQFFLNQLDKQMDDLFKLFKTFNNRLNDPKFLSDPSEMISTTADLRRIDSDITKASNEMNECVKYKVMFGGKPPQLDPVHSVTAECKWKLEMWSLLCEFTEYVSTVKHTVFMDINRTQIMQTFTQTHKTCSRLERDNPPNVVLVALREELNEFQKILPVIEVLFNPHLKATHWDHIRNTISGSPQQWEDDVTLGWVLEQGALNHSVLLNQISEEATQEAILQESLNQLVAKWEHMTFKLRVFNGDILLLVEIDEILREYDDSIIQLNTIKASRYSLPLIKDIENWLHNLNTLDTILDQWMKLQKKYVYLNPVFRSDDLLKEFTKKWNECDNFWRDMMTKTKTIPDVLRVTQQPGLITTFKQHNATLDRIQEALEGLLNSKRAAFGRFFFLPNDDLLEILKEGKNVSKVLGYLNKLFDNIKTLTLHSEKDARKLEIVAMQSSEGEEVPFEDKIVPRSKPVETWMKEIEHEMEKTLQAQLQQAVTDLFNISKQPKKKETHNSEPYFAWIRTTKAQLVLAASQILWTDSIERAFASQKPLDELQNVFAMSEQILLDLTQLTRQDLTDLERTSVGAMIVVQVHARDIIQELLTDGVSSSESFEWQKRLRYYWDAQENSCLIRQTVSSFWYGYEYLGCTPRLVITPLTDKCYITLTSALHFKMGGAPAGPAGTGKTETTKDLAKAVARQCVVFNCSDGLNVETMRQMFTGMCQVGAWFCFDEFNRIDIEVLSVVAQQIREIQDAQHAGYNQFWFQGNETPLNANCAVFITMNPGYAGRTELPDNLAALFRPVTMMIPDYALIAEIMLYSEGFATAKVLARKMAQLYKLSSEQLSQQSHYDFGMRAVKSVLVMAGQLRRDAPDLSEEVVLIRAMTESNIPKFLADDIVLFNAIVGDLFPESHVPETDYGELMSALKEVYENGKFQQIPNQIHKTIELFDTMTIRHGVMLIGPTQGGKTTIRNILAETMSLLRTKESTDHRFQIVEQSQMNPKAISVDEMFGCFNDITQEWKEGLLSFFVQRAVMSETTSKKWIIFDGPVDTLWVESLNTVLDDSKTLCLPNRKRIKLTEDLSLLFEVQDLQQASPATVSRCGMVYVDDAFLTWRGIINRWLNRLDPEVWPEWLKKEAQVTFEDSLPPIIEGIRDGFTPDIPQPIIAHVQNVLRIVDAILTTENGFFPDRQNPDEEEEGQPKRSGSTSHLKTVKQVGVDWVGWVKSAIFYAVLWGIGGNLRESEWEKFDTLLRDSFCQLYIPIDGLSYEVGIDIKDKWLCPLEVPDYQHSPNVHFNSILVPTIDTVRYGFLVRLLIGAKVPVLVTGETGVGKTVILEEIIRRKQKGDEVTDRTLSDDRKGTQQIELSLSEAATPEQTEPSEIEIVGAKIGFSAQTSSNRLQTMIEEKLQNRRDHFSAPPHTTVAILLDDFNMPTPDKFGSQPPLELIRQLLGTGGWYDRSVLQFRPLKGTTLVAACGPPGGGRNQISPRLTSQFVQLRIPQPTEQSLFLIFNSILNGFVQQFSFPAVIQDIVPMIVRASVALYHFVIDALKPLPSKAHYVFNVRDLSKIVGGLMQATPKTVEDEQVFMRLWSHESIRVFGDRLVCDEDREILTREIVTIAKKVLHVTWKHDEVFGKGNEQIWVNFLTHTGTEEFVYEEVSDMKKVGQRLLVMLNEFNQNQLIRRQNEVNLVFFKEAISHIARITRILGQKKGHTVLVGVGGCGKQSLTRLSAFICECRCFEVQASRHYGLNEFREDIRNIFSYTGAEGKRAVFLLSDTQLTSDSFLEDINCLLNSGDVPGLFDAAQKEAILAKLRDCAKTDEEVPDVPDAALEMLVERVRQNLHVVLCMSPIGDSFRNRCRMFPSLINCCTINWVENWPADALESVGHRLLENVDLGNDPQERLKSRPNTPTATLLKRGGGEVKTKKEEAMDQSLLDRVSQLAVEIHTDVLRWAELYWEEERRRVYVTPAMFIETLTMFKRFLHDMRAQNQDEKKKYEGGMKTLKETRESIGVMQAELKNLEPTLVKQADDLKQLVDTIEKERAKTETIRSTVAEEETVVGRETEKAKELAQATQAELDTIMPVFIEANQALESLSKAAVTEVKSFANPPEPVKQVMNAVCTLFGKKPDWDNSRALLNQTNFIQMLVNFNVNNIDTSMAKKMKPFLDDPNFEPQKVESVSKAAANICQWVVAIVEFARVNKLVEPKKKAADKAQNTVDELTAVLAVKQTELKKLEEAVNALETTLEEKKNEQKKTELEIDQTRTRCKNAEKLLDSLGDEGERWTQQLEVLADNAVFLLGSSLLSAASVSYLGGFGEDHRKRMLVEWTHFAEDRVLPSTEVGSVFSMEQALSSDVEIRDWQVQTLPSDKLSLENATIMTKTRKWPLVVDPQGQANRWIKAKERNNKLRVMRMTDPGLIRNLGNSIRFGHPVLLEDVGEEIDPQLNPVLAQQTSKLGGRTVLRLNEQDIEYNSSFRLFITTKLPNPIFLPEIFIKTCVVNFSVTSEGLEEQLLTDVVKHEKAEIEEAKDQLVRGMASDSKLLAKTEEEILNLMRSTNTQQLLDDTSLIHKLEQSKKTANEIKDRVKANEETEVELMAARNQYNPMAVRATSLFFCMVDLSKLDPMYQYSLQYFKGIFNLSLTQTEEKDTLQERLDALIENLTKLVFSNVIRGLFQTHRVFFSFLMTVRIRMREGKLPQEHLKLFLKGQSGFETAVEKDVDISSLPEITITHEPRLESVTEHHFELSTPPVSSGNKKELDTKIPEALSSTSSSRSGRRRSVAVTRNEEPQIQWNTLTSPQGETLLRLEAAIGGHFQGITDIFLHPPDKHTKECLSHWIGSPSPVVSMLPEKLKKTLSNFENLLLVRFLFPERLTNAVQKFVELELGGDFCNSPGLDLQKAFKDSSSSTPIVFILSSGADPLQHLVRFAQSQGFQDRMHLLSLGQGQGPHALKMVNNSAMRGEWVFLQNCHLAASWMSELERIVLSFDQPDTKPQSNDFRLWLSSMPTTTFPVPVLQNSIKLTNEPPAGIRANMLQTASAITPDEFLGKDQTRPFEWRRLLIGLTFYHAIIQERRKYGALGWNVQYAFNESDFEMSRRHLSVYLSPGGGSKTIGWAALKYMTGEVNYGGRVSDEWDMRVLSAYLSIVYDPSIVLPNRSFDILERYSMNRISTPTTALISGSNTAAHSQLNSPSNHKSPFSRQALSVKASPVRTAATIPFKDSAYTVPSDVTTLAAFQSFIETLPSIDDVDVFGLHPNAEKVFQLEQAGKIVSNLKLLVGSEVNDERIHERQSKSSVNENEGTDDTGIKENGDNPEPTQENKPDAQDEEIPNTRVDRSRQLIEAQLEAINKIVSILPRQITPPRLNLRRDENSSQSNTDLHRQATQPTLSSTNSHTATQATLPPPIIEEPVVVDSLVVVLGQEVERFNRLLTQIDSTLSELIKSIKGLVIASPALEDLQHAITSNTIPSSWALFASPSLRPLSSWLQNLVERVEFFRSWVENGPPLLFSLPAFFFPQGFLAAVLQRFARKYVFPIDQLTFHHIVQSEEAMSRLVFVSQNPINSELDEDLIIEPTQSERDRCSDGVVVDGLVIEGGQWSEEEGRLVDETADVLFSKMPPILFLPERDFVPDEGCYHAPLYKTAERCGVLSTTGHSTNFVTSVALPSNYLDTHWILRGCALLCEPRQLGE